MSTQKAASLSQSLATRAITCAFAATLLLVAGCGSSPQMGQPIKAKTAVAAPEVTALAAVPAPRYEAAAAAMLKREGVKAERADG